MRFKRAFGVAVGRDGSGRFWFAERYAPMVLTLVAFAVVAFAPQLGDASPRHPHRANGWARTLYKPKLAHVSLPKLGPGNRIASKGPARPAKAPKGKPLPLLTTATSRAYATKNGMTETRIFAAPVNYKGTDEKWHPIQNRLVSAGKGALRNKANRYKLTLPRTANRPVRMRIGRSLLSQVVTAHGRAVRVFTTHLDVHHVDDRYYETSDVAAFASHPNNASRSVVAGDLNTDEHERASFGPLVFQPFWSADVFHRDLASGGTFYANGTKPDWIFAGPNMGILNTGMLSSMNHALSDHYPLVANMAVG